MENDINFRSGLSPEVKNLIKDMLRINPHSRLSMNQIFNSPWVQKEAKK